jgi:hypothetical protein
VRNEIRNLNNLGEDKRRNNVGFALQILQRRLASFSAALPLALGCRPRAGAWIANFLGG